MFILGHMVFSYLLGRFVAHRLGLRSSPSLLLLSGAVPDYDLLFGWIGIRHHTITHSVVFWLPIVVVTFLLFGAKSVPYSVGVVQHFLLNDLLVGTVPLVYPISDSQIGLQLGMPSAIDTFLEVGVLALVLMYMLSNQDLRMILQPSRENWLAIIPLVTMVALSWIASGEAEFGPLIAFAFSRRALTAITIGHVVLGFLLAISFVAGLRALMPAAEETRTAD